MIMFHTDDKSPTRMIISLPRMNNYVSHRFQIFTDLSILFIGYHRTLKRQANQSSPL